MTTTTTTTPSPKTPGGGRRRRDDDADDGDMTVPATRAGAGSAFRPGEKFAQHAETARATLSADMYRLYELEWARVATGQPFVVDEVVLPCTDGRQPARFENKAAFETALHKFAGKNTESRADLIAANIVYARVAGTGWYITGFLTGDAGSGGIAPLVQHFCPADVKNLSLSNLVKSDHTTALASVGGEHARVRWLKIQTSDGRALTVPPFDPRRLIENALRRWAPKASAKAKSGEGAAAAAVATADAEAAPTTQKKKKRANLSLSARAAATPPSVPTRSSDDGVFDAATEEEWSRDSQTVYAAAITAAAAASTTEAATLAGLVSREKTPHLFRQLAAGFPENMLHLGFEERARLAAFPSDFAVDTAALEAMTASADSPPAETSWDALPLVQALAVASNPLGWLAAPGFRFLAARGVLLGDAKSPAPHLRQFEADPRAQASLLDTIAQMVVSTDFVDHLASLPSVLLAEPRRAAVSSVFLAVAALAQSLARLCVTTFPRTGNTRAIRCALTGCDIAPGAQVIHAVFLLKPLDTGDVQRSVPLDEVHCIIQRRVSHAWCPLFKGFSTEVQPQVQPQLQDVGRHSPLASPNTPHQEQPAPPPQPSASMNTPPPTASSPNATAAPRKRPPKTEEQKQRDRERAAERKKLRQQAELEKQQEQAASAHSDDEEEKVVAKQANGKAEPAPVAPTPKPKPQHERPSMEENPAPKKRQRKASATPAAAPTTELKKPSTLPPAIGTGFVGANAALVHPQTKQTYLIDGGAYFKAILELLRQVVATQGDGKTTATTLAASNTGLSLFKDARTIADAFAAALEKPSAEMTKTLLSSRDGKKSFITALQLLAAILASPDAKQQLLAARHAADPHPPPGLTAAAAPVPAAAATAFDSMFDLLDELAVDSDAMAVDSEKAAAPVTPPLTLEDVYYVDAVPLAPSLVANGNAGALIQNMEKARANATFSNKIFENFTAQPDLRAAIRATAENEADEADILARIPAVFAALFPAVAKEMAGF